MKFEGQTNKRTLLDVNDGVTIKKYIKGIEGGRTLDCSGFENGTKLCAGHVIASKAATDGTKTYFPVAVEGDAYKALEEGQKYEGVLYRSKVIENGQIAASIMTWGIVNSACIPFALPEAFKKACIHIDEQTDEEA